MPESVKDRCTKAHEYIFLLSKNAKYYCDMDLIREPVKKSNKGFIMARARTASGALGGENKHNMERRDYREIKGANKRSVWTVTTKPFKGAHFATFPPDLIEPCVLAGCPENGTVLDPFGGAGTTGLVAQQHNRNAVLIELNPEYAEMAKNRIYNDAPLFSSVKLIKPNENKGFRQNDH
jgi:site-specific DNA-methyltransferase (adenine-specific)